MSLYAMQGKKGSRRSEPGEIGSTIVKILDSASRLGRMLEQLVGRPVEIPDWEQWEEAQEWRRQREAARKGKQEGEQEEGGDAGASPGAEGEGVGEGEGGARGGEVAISLPNAGEGGDESASGGVGGRSLASVLVDL